MHELSMRSKSMSKLYIALLPVDYHYRPYYVKCTGSHPNSEVKWHKARLVLRWGTARETLVLIVFLFFLILIIFLQLLYQASSLLGPHHPREGKTYGVFEI